jgi:hypothetical protein
LHPQTGAARSRNKVGAAERDTIRIPRKRSQERKERVKGVQLDISDRPESAEHLVNVEDAIRIAMARQ